MACDRKDRHASAAAVRGDAKVLVTFNIGDLPDTSTSCDDITVVYPDDFLLDQLDLYRRHCSGAARPKRTATTLLGWISRTCSDDSPAPASRSSRRDETPPVETQC
jgi:hypothetical protein